MLYRNTGTKTAPQFTLVTASFQDIKFGRRAAPTLVDMNGDGKPDLLVGNEAGELQLWRNGGRGPGDYRMELDSTFTLHSYANASPAVGNLHGDGKLDIPVGTGAGVGEVVLQKGSKGER